MQAEPLPRIPTSTDRVVPLKSMILPFNSKVSWGYSNYSTIQSFIRYLCIFSKTNSHKDKKQECCHFPSSTAPTVTHACACLKRASFFRFLHPYRLMSLSKRMTWQNQAQQRLEEHLINKNTMRDGGSIALKNRLNCLHFLHCCHCLNCSQCLVSYCAFIYNRIRHVTCCPPRWG